MNLEADKRDAWRSGAEVLLRAANRTAIVSALFSLCILSLLLANMVSSRFVDPLKPVRLQERMLELNRDKTNEKLKAEIRRMDRDIRTTYFKGRAFAGRGFYLLLGGVVVFLLAVESAKACKRELPSPRADASQEVWLTVASSRQSVAGVGTILAGLLMTLAVISRHDAAAEYTKAASLEFQRELHSTAITASPPSSMVTLPPGTSPVTSLSSPKSTAPVTGISNVTVPAQPLGIKPSSISPVKPKSTAPAIRMLSGSPHPAAWEDNWPVFRGPAGIGVASTVELPTSWNASAGSGILWKSAIPLPGWNSPVIWGDRLFLAGADKHTREVYCFSASMGAIVWKHTIPVSGKSPDIKLMEGTGYAPSTAVTDGKRVCVGFPNGDVACLSVDGKQLWLRHLGAPVNSYGHASSLTLYGNGLIVQYDQGKEASDGKSALIALDIVTGDVVWKVSRPVPSSWSTPVIIRAGKGDQLITCANPWVIAYDPHSGQELWRADCLKGDVVPSVAVGSGFVLACNQGATLAAIRPDGTGDVTKTSIAWTYTEDIPDIASPVSNGDLVFLVTSEGLVICVDCRTGKKVWDHDYHTMFHASPIIAGNSLYALDTKGTMYIVEAARAFKEIGKGSVDEETEATPAIAKGRIYIRSAKNLFCIGTK